MVVTGMGDWQRQCLVQLRQFLAELLNREFVGATLILKPINGVRQRADHLDGDTRHISMPSVNRFESRDTQFGSMEIYFERVDEKVVL